MAAPKKPRKRPAAKRRARPKAKTGRPEVEIDLAELEKLAGLACTVDDIAAWFGCSRNTILRRLADDKRPEFRHAWECGRGKGRVSLRRSQFKLAEKNATMAIWLGKQLLGQKDERFFNVKTIDHMSEAEILELLGGEPDGDELDTAGTLEGMPAAGSA